MTQRIVPCASCVHFRPERRDGNYCDAFPDGDGIPEIIIMGRVTHRAPYPGDHGVQWEPRPGMEGALDRVPLDGEPFPPSPLGN